MAIASALKHLQWPRVAQLTLFAWLMGSFMMDGMLMPSLYASGMLTQPGFACTGYLMFGLFNHVELICAAIVLTGLLVKRQGQVAQSDSFEWLIGLGLLGITLLLTYALAPAMSGLSLNLQLFDPPNVPDAMTSLHLSYWLLEATKFVAGIALLRHSFSIPESTDYSAIHS
jgi:hypothetical protein